MTPATTSIIVAKDSDYIIEAFKQLIENHISSAPVLNTETGEYHYFIDLSDMLAHAVDILTENEIKEGFDPEITQIEFSRYTVAQLAGYSPTNRFKTVPGNVTLGEAIKALINHQVHRLVITRSTSDITTFVENTSSEHVAHSPGRSGSKEGELVSILSQSTVVELIYPFINECPFKDKTVAELKIGYRATATVSTDSPTREAFKKLHSGRYEGLAVTDSSDNLVGNISISDLSLIGYDGSMFKRLMYPLSKFLEGRLAKPHSHKAKHGLAGILTVSPEHTIKQVFDKFHQTEVHRLYIEQNRRLLGVIVLADLVRLVAQEVLNYSAGNAHRRTVSGDLPLRLRGSSSGSISPMMSSVNSGSNSPKDPGSPILGSSPVTSSMNTSVISVSPPRRGSKKHKHKEKE